MRAPTFVEVNHAAAVRVPASICATNWLGSCRRLPLPMVISWSTTVEFEASLQEMLDFQPSSAAHQSCAEVDYGHMRKRLITQTTETVQSRGEGWLDVERAAVV